MKANRLAGAKAYLVGPMDRIADGGVEWREDISTFLWNMKCGVLNPCKKPMRGVDESSEAREWRKFLKQKAGEGYSSAADALSQMMKNIVGSDLRMVDLANFIIMYIDTDVHMCGSYAEQTHACLQKKPVIICCKQGKWGVPDWLWGICKHQLFFNNWDEVKRYITHINEDDEKTIDTLNKWVFLDQKIIYGEQ